MSALAGIVLAGGAGRRYGQPKATVAYGGSTLVEHAVAMLVPLCAEVVVVGRAEVPLPTIQVRVVDDRPGPDCPLNALATGLAAVESDDVLVLGCDLPNAAPLLAKLAEATGHVVAVDADGRAQPLCARYLRSEALAESEGLLVAGELRLLALLDRLSVATIPGTMSELLNVNTPADLAALVEPPAQSRPVTTL